MKNTSKLISLILLFLAVSVLDAAAQSATLTWDPNSEPEVIGYNIYYRTDSPAFPFNGTTLNEGASPIYVDGAGTTSLTLELPDDGRIYYFTATAVSDGGLESTYSGIIASEWIPLQITPSNNQAVSTAPTFTWGDAPSGYNVTYELHYGTDPLLPASAALVSPARHDRNGSRHDETTNDAGRRSPIHFFWAFPLALIAALLTTRRSEREKAFLTPLKIILCAGVLALQAACGGGGGGSSDIPSSGSSDYIDFPAPQSVTVITDIDTTSYQVSDLQPGTQYYWKVVAVDETGYRFESVVQSFTTAVD